MSIEAAARRAAVEIAYWSVNGDRSRPPDSKAVEEITTIITAELESLPSTREIQSRLIKLAAAIIQHRGFLSPDAEDNPASKKVLRIADRQNEQLRLWAIALREIADSLESLPSEREQTMSLHECNTPAQRFNAVREKAVRDSVLEEAAQIAESIEPTRTGWVGQGDCTKAAIITAIRARIGKKKENDA